MKLYKAKNITTGRYVGDTLASAVRLTVRRHAMIKPSPYWLFYLGPRAKFFKLCPVSKNGH